MTFRATCPVPEPKAESTLDQGRFLRRNDAVYRALVEGLSRESSDPEAVLWSVRQIAEFSEESHPGRFADGELENAGFEIGERLERELSPRRTTGEKPPRLPRHSGRRHLLHVATSVHRVGGHTRTIKNWVSDDSDSCHSLVLTGQAKEAVPGWLLEAVQASGGGVWRQLVRESLLTRARGLREMARQADLVILHHFGHDVIPIAALAVTDVPPVALHNHADHLFWMGGTVADTVCQLRGISRVLSDRRFVQNEVDLPIPLATAAGRLSREEARQQLAIPQDQVALVSVGRACKYIPTPTHDFLRTANAILEEHPQAHVYLVGVSAVEPLIRWDVAAHPRFHFVGPVEDPALYQQAADVYLEGFPFGSQTACLESALAGLPVVLAYAPPLDLLATSDEALDGLTVTPTTEEAYRAEVSRLLADPRRHLRGQELRERVLAVHTGEGWRERLEAFYRHALSRPHAPRKLPASPCVASTRDVALSYWHELNGCSSLSRDGVGATIREVRLAAAHGARQAGQHRTALRLLCGSLRRWGWSDRVAKAILTLGLHWIAPPSRREPRPRLAGSRRS